MEIEIKKGKEFDGEKGRNGRERKSRERQEVSGRALGNGVEKEPNTHGG